MIFLILVVVVLACFISIFYFMKNRKENSIRQCSYGNIKAYNILKNTNDYSLLKKQLAEAKSFEERYFFSVSISRLYPIEILERWVSKEPKSADAFLCYGARLVQWSWAARGYGMGNQVGKERWKVFFERLEKAHSVLMKSANLMPSDPTPWAYLIIVSTWNSDDHETRSYYFDQAIERDPYNWAAHMYRVIALSEKWGGDNEEMISFAERASINAPPGIELPAILIKAYLEYWKYLDVFQDKPDEANTFIQSEEIQSKALSAYMRSLGSENHKETAVSIFAHYNTSAWFWVVRNQKILKHDLDYLGEKIEDIHWRWAGPEGELNEARSFSNKS
ncbi:tetratricopeptide repeat protein [Spartinivicinus poritis]|uniref:DUF4034 domain-containing protein n=1 Tax=Spartinivicinus poritis TaxID=2994640 RepID=A0ABT5UGY6_9GAMM|nr:hypothetical protein [Spartinivicinus sp. A2-2]MDE1465572.1 hypothetical protein [Spartinivicinus sp. A2-2]